MALRALILLFLLVPVSAHAAAPETMGLCRNAALASADRHGIPREVMLAITLVETRTRREGVSGPWPWTVNVAGKGGWFDSRAAALIHAQQALGRGEKSFDVGCFQLNYRWHGQHFASIDEMFEPGPSGDYAARFLKSLHQETGDWIKASGLYHSRTQHHAKRYRGLVARTVKAMGGEVPEFVAAADPEPPTGPLVLRVGEPGAGALVQGRVRAPRGTRTVSAGGVGLGMLQGARGGLIQTVPRGG
ncbi:MAG: lytic transglycosylase domain-containing protein [Pseudomonadota bacterium]